MKEKKEGKEGSQSISQKDEGKFNKKAKENHREAPTPVIGCVPHLSKSTTTLPKIEIMRRKHTYIVFPGSHNLIFSDSCPTCTLHISNRGISHHFPCNICNCAVPSRLVSEIRLPT
jgi:hypothetical protein